MNNIANIIINGQTIPMHSNYLFERKKVYTKSPERTINGNMIFADKIFVPYFTATWNYITISDFTKLMALTENDENVVQYYDTYSDVYSTAKFAIQQPQYNKMFNSQKQINGVLGLELVFDGTLNDVDLVTVEFNINSTSASGTESSLSGWIGQEFTLPTGDNLIDNNYKVKSWNTKADGTGVTYILGATISLASSMTLYAIWETNSTFTLSYNYDVGTVPLDISNEPIYNKEVIYGEVVGELPTTTAKTITYDGVEITEPYTFNGWFSIAKGLGTEYTQATVYNVQGNSTIYAYFVATQFTITFNSNGGNYTPTSITQDYKSTIYKPYDPIKTGYTFGGWYMDAELTTEFSWTIMPPQNTTLYAKWSE